jgi:hypothetical protein
MCAYSRQSIKAYKIKVLVRDENDAEVVIGKAQSFEVKVDNKTEFLKELGNENPAEINEGIAETTGTLVEAMINFNMFGKGIRDGNGDLPYLTLSGTLPLPSGGSVNLVASGVKLDSVEIPTALENKWLKGTYPFKAIKLDRV